MTEIPPIAPLKGELYYIRGTRATNKHGGLKWPLPLLANRGTENHMVSIGAIPRSQYQFS